jgi:hypothetical protein
MGVRILACPSFNNQILTTNQYACQYSKPVTVTIHPCSRSSFKVSSTKDAFDSLYLPRPGPRDAVFVCLDAWTGYGAWASACKTLPRAWLPGNKNGFRFLAARLARDASEHAAVRKLALRMQAGEDARAGEARVTTAPFAPFFRVISSPPPPLSPILIRALALCLSALSFPASSSCSSKSSSTVVAGDDPLLVVQIHGV